MEIYVYEGDAVHEADRFWKDRSEATKKIFGQGTGWVRRQWVGEDGGAGTPSLFMSLGDDRRVEIMLSPPYAKKIGTEKAIERLLVRIATGLTADD